MVSDRGAPGIISLSSVMEGHLVSYLSSVMVCIEWTPGVISWSSVMVGDGGAPGVMFEFSNG